MEKRLHIISFDVPYPANYGGVIDVFYKLRNLHKAGVKIILHCFEYGRGEQKELEKYCEKVFYYKRKNSFLNQLSFLPFIVRSRVSEEMMQNLLKNDRPILFEGLHTCYYVSDKRIANRTKIYRESNIEHEYYVELAKAEKNIVKKLFFTLESARLKSFEKILRYADRMLVVSTADAAYLQEKFPKNKIEYLPSFHPFDEVQIKEGKGNYILYHGNLSVAENIKAVEFLISEVFSKITHQVVIAGLNPSFPLQKLVNKHSNISLVSNPSDDKMQGLIENAHIHCLYTFQPSGLKLKLLNVLYNGRFCICNENMLAGTGLQNTCIIKNTAPDIISSIEQVFAKEFTAEFISSRKQYLQVFQNEEKTSKVLSYL